MKNSRILFSCSSFSNFITAFSSAVNQSRHRFSIKRTLEIITVLRSLRKAGYVKQFRLLSKQKIEVTISRTSNISAVKKIRQISRPGNPIFYNQKYLREKCKFQEFYLISTNQGLKEVSEAILSRLGGKPLLQVIC